MPIQPEHRKYAELIKYISAKSSNDPYFGKTKLFKILFYSDFLAYRELGQSISGDRYVKQTHGPVPTRINYMIKTLVEKEELALSPGYLGTHVQQKPVHLSRPDLSVFSADEIAIVDEVIESLRGKSARQVSELSHEFIGWKVAEMGMNIPYEIALVGAEEITEEDIEFGSELIEEAQKALSSCRA